MEYVEGKKYIVGVKDAKEDFKFNGFLKEIYWADLKCSMRILCCCSKKF